MTSATSAQGITSKDIGFSPKNLCQGRNPINPNPQNGPTGPLGQALPGAEYNNQSDGSDVYCGTTPPKNPYYQDTNDPNYQPGNDESDQFEKDSKSDKSGTGRNSVKFDTMLDACEWQYPQYQYVIDVLINYLDTTSWECWGAPS
jgi:hypothetical protein